MSGPHRVTQQVGDLAFDTGESHPTEAQALLAAVDMTAASDEDVELFVEAATVALGAPKRRAPQVG